MKLLMEKGVDISPEMIGLFFEDINFAADGGLYAEMIENRSFEAKLAMGVPGSYAAIDDPGYAWDAVADADGQEPKLLFVQGTPLSAVNPHYLRIISSGAGQGFVNKAYDGIYLKKEMVYHVSFYARSINFMGSKVTVSICKDGKTYASADVAITKPMGYLPFCDTIPVMHAYVLEQEDAFQAMRKENEEGGTYLHEWIKYECNLAASEEIRNGQFTITLDGSGAVEFDLISMIPDDAVAGVFRKDLFNALKDIKPGFVRFPGGCIVEGISLDNGYRWKETVGNIKDRRYKPNLWAFLDDSALALREEGVYVAPSGTADGVILKIVNRTKEEKIIPLTDGAGNDIVAEASVWTLNDITKCDEKSEVQIKGGIAVPQESFIIIEINR